MFDHGRGHIPEAHEQRQVPQGARLRPLPLLRSIGHLWGDR